MQDESLLVCGRIDALCVALESVAKYLVKTRDRDVAVAARVLSKLLLQQMDTLKWEARHA